MAAPRLTTQLEQLPLRGDCTIGLGVALLGPIEQHLGKHDLVGSIALGLETSLSREQLIDAVGDDRRIGERLGLVEADQNVPCIDPVALPHAQLSDDAASGVLDLLDAQIHHDHALGDHRADNWVVVAQPPTPKVTRANMIIPTIM